MKTISLMWKLSVSNENSLVRKLSVSHENSLMWKLSVSHKNNLSCVESISLIQKQSVSWGNYQSHTKTICLMWKLSVSHKKNLSHVETISLTQKQSVSCGNYQARKHSSCWQNKLQSKTSPKLLKFVEKKIWYILFFYKYSTCHTRGTWRKILILAFPQICWC